MNSISRRVKTDLMIEASSTRVFFMVPASKKPWIRYLGLPVADIDSIEMDVYELVEYRYGMIKQRYRYLYTKK